MNKLFGQRRFERQALRHLDSLYFAALKLTGHREDAEDLVQETYSKAFNHVNQLRDLEKCKPWLYRIMINIWKNLKTKRSREIFPENQEYREASTSQHADGNPQTHQINPEQNLMIKELWKDVESALTRLPSNYRLAVILSDIEGFTYKEISKITEWPLGTVMSSLSRARRQLGRLLIKYKERT
jgi:RNA polymerase sigma-70 factor (ECF subfamily)